MASASPALGGTGRWSARRKVSVVIALLTGESLERLSRRHGVPAAKLSPWRDDFVAGGEARLKHREVAVEDEDRRRLKSVAADLATDKALRAEKIRPLAAGRPVGWWRAKRCVTRCRPPPTGRTASSASRACGRCLARRSTRNGTGAPGRRRGPSADPSRPVGCGADGRDSGRDRRESVPRRRASQNLGAPAGAGPAHVETSNVGRHARRRLARPRAAAHAGRVNTLTRLSKKSVAVQSRRSPEHMYSV